MSLEQNKQIVEEFYTEIINNRNFEAIGNYLTDDFMHNGEQRGAAGQKQIVQYFLNAFSGIVNTIELSLAEGDLVCIHEKWTGKHTGEFMGVAATGKNISWTSTAILKIRDRKISQAWDENDLLGLFQQIGKYPEIG